MKHLSAAYKRVLEIAARLSASKLYKSLVFAGAFVAVVFYFGIHEVLFLRPQSIHIWRQTDCLSITQNYYQRSLPFLEPEIYNQLADQNTSGKSAGEFPVLYYTLAQLWKVFGKHEFIYRLFTLLITFLGLFSLFHLTDSLLKNHFQALFISLILFISPVFAYYSVSFLPNVPAFALALSAWYFVHRFYCYRDDYWLWIAVGLFTLAMLLKVSSGIGFVALWGWLMIEWLRKPGKRTIFTRPALNLIPFLISVALIALWYLYASWYNAKHGGAYTFNNVWPVWEMSAEQIRNTWNSFQLLWQKEIYHNSLFDLSVIFWIMALIFCRKLPGFLIYLLVVMPLGCLIYLLLWFQALDSHDYYYIEVYALFPLVWIAFFKTFNNYKIVNNFIINILLVAFFINNVGINRPVFKERFAGWMNQWHHSKLEAVGELETVLESLGIDEDELVISIPDPTINATLYLMNRRGFNDYGSDFNHRHIFIDRIDKGANYLIVNDSLRLEHPVVQEFIEYPLGSHKNVRIFDLRPYRTQNE